MRSLFLAAVGAALSCGLVTTATGDEGGKPAAAGAASAPAGLRMILPPLVYAVPGFETNIYFDNVCLMLNPKNYAFEVDCARGKQFEERWAWTPTEKDVGDIALKISVRDAENRTVATGSTIVRVAPPDAGADQPLSLLCIGDSLTNASVYPQQIHESCLKPGNPKLTLVGSNRSRGESDPVRHEGYGGWTAHRFVTLYTGVARTGDLQKRGSPFLYAQPTGDPKLDFVQYCKDVNDGRLPDRVTIFLGCNDVFSAKDDTLEARVNEILSWYDQLVAMIRTSSPSSRIGVMLLVPPTATQDAFGFDYGNYQTRWQYKRNQHRLVERMMEHYGKREAENIDLIPTHLNLDCVHNYPTTQVLANARSTEKLTLQGNSVHPSASGYQQIGDSVYCWLKATAPKPPSGK